VNDFVFVLAAMLGCGKHGRYWVGRYPSEWHGLDILTLADAVRRAGLGPIDDDVLASVMARVAGWQKVNGSHIISGKRLGEILSVTAAERETLRLWAIDAVDEPKADRAARKTAERRAWDNERKRRDRETQESYVTRDAYESESLSRTKPWEALGISRRTWERRRAAANGQAVASAANGQADASGSTDNTTVGGHVEQLASSAPKGAPKAGCKDALGTDGAQSGPAAPVSSGASAAQDGSQSRLAAPAPDGDSAEQAGDAAGKPSTPKTVQVVPPVQLWVVNGIRVNRGDLPLLRRKRAA